MKSETSIRLEIFKDSLFDAFQYNAQLNLPNYLDLAQYWPNNKQGPIMGVGANGKGSGTTGPIVTTIADIQWPIDFQVHTMNPAPETNQITIKTFEECWITGYGVSYDAGAKTVMESVTFTFRNTMISTAAVVNTFPLPAGSATNNGMAPVAGDTGLLVTNSA